MKKRLVSFILAVVMLTGIIPMTAYAADYETELRNKGFPESYIPYLSELHKKYPKWEFQALDTGETWAEAVSRERNPHKQQVVQMTASNDKRNFYCQCPDCYVNGSYVIREGKSWVAASESAVAYYMDPHESLDERYIFQFETIDSNKDATQAGVEAILSGTWMYNANITYKDASGNNNTLQPAKKYSQAIMEAASKSGLSAYFLASKIVQEVGGKAPTAGGASGTYSGYEGIYNYYNICANTGAKDGLDWASTSSGVYKTNCNAILRQGPTTSSSKLVTIPNKTVVTYLGTTPTQSDGYKWYNIRATVNGTTYTGYVRSDLIDGGTADKYNRPWTNPYISIINGAVWIANNFKTQNTGYLQKFNVNPASGSQMHNHEYMANVQAASQEASKTYNAYNAAGLLNTAKKFLIPVYYNMPNGGNVKPEDLEQVKNVRLTGTTKTSAVLYFDEVKGADIYKLQLNTNGVWYDAMTTTKSGVTVSKLADCTTFKARVAAGVNVNGKYVFSEKWSDETSFDTKSQKISGFKLDSVSNDGTSVTVSWTPNAKADGYRIFAVNGNSETELARFTGGSTKSYTLTGLTPGTEYRLILRAYKGGYNNLGDNSDIVTAKTPYNINGLQVKNVRLTGTTKTSAVLYFDEVKGADIYKLQLNTNGVWYDAMTTAKSGVTVSKLADCTTFKARVAAGVNVNGKYVFSEKWSDETSFDTKSQKISGFRLDSVSNDGTSVTVSWTPNAKADGYRIFAVNGSSETELARFTGGSTKSYTLTGLAPDTEYKLIIRAYKGGYNNLGDNSDVVTAKTPYNINGLQVKNVRLTGTTKTSAVLYFDEVKGADIYKLQLNTNGVWYDAMTTAKSGVTVSKLADCTTFKARVAAGVNVNGKYVFSEKWSDETSFDTKSQKISGFKLDSASNDGTSVTVSWTPNAKADGYRIFAVNGSSETELARFTGGSTKSYTLTGLTPDTEYRLIIRAYKGGYNNLGDNSDVVTAKTPYNINGLQVKNVRLTGTTKTSAVLYFDEVKGADIYKLQLNTNGVWYDAMTTAKSGVTVSKLADCTTFKARVAAGVNVNGKYVFSEKWSDETSFDTKSQKISGFKLDSVSNDGTSVTVSWTPNAKADGYRIFAVNGSSETELARFTGGSTKSYTLTGLTPGTEYRLIIRAYKGGYNNLGDNSDVVTAKTPYNIEKLDTAKNIRLTGTTTSSVNLYFDKVNGADSYRIQVLINDVWTDILKTSSNSVTLGGFEDSTSFKLRIASGVQIGEKIVYSDKWSDIGLFDTKPLQITNLESYYIDENDPTQIALFWDAQPKASGYRVFGRIAGTNDWETIGIFYNTSDEEPGCIITDLAPNTKYEFTVSAFRGGQNNLGEIATPVEYYYY